MARYPLRPKTLFTPLHRDLGRVRSSFSTIDYGVNHGYKDKELLITDAYIPIAVICPVIYCQESIPNIALLGYISLKVVKRR